MPEQEKVLILTSDAGFGHRKAAEAVCAALQELYGDQVQVDIVNPLDDERAPSVLRDNQSDYDRMVRETPEVYKLQYKISDSSVPATLLESAVIVMLYRVIQDLVEKYQPDVILANHPMLLAPTNAVIASRKGSNIPYLTLVTDLATIHRSWLNPTAELCLLPTEAAYQQALEAGMPEAMLRVTGIPVHPNLVQEMRPAAELREELGWRPDLTTLLAVGSKRVKGMPDMLHVLNHSGLPVQLVVVCGGDDELYAEYQQVEWHGVTHLYNYVDTMPTFMRAADAILCKAGGLTVTESLACGLPMLLMDVTPGQEEGNARYVVSNGAADLVETPLQALETLSHWLLDGGELLHHRALMARALGRPRAAYDVAQALWEKAILGPQPIPAARLSLLPKLAELLAQVG